MFHLLACDKSVAETPLKRNPLVKCQSMDAEVESEKVRRSPKPAEYTSPGHSNKEKKVKEFKTKKTTFARSIESSQWKEAALQGMSPKELVDHLEGLRNTVKRLQHSTLNVTLEEDISVGS